MLSSWVFIAAPILLLLGDWSHLSLLDVEAGELQISEGFDSSGTTQVAQDAILTLSGEADFTATSDLDVDGTLRIIGGVTELGGSVDVATLLMQGGSAELRAGPTVQEVELSNGTVNFEGEHSVAQLSIAGGSVSVDGSLTVTDTLLQTGGEIRLAHEGTIDLAAANGGGARIAGSSGDDTIFGTSGDEIIDGGSGKDHIETGLGGNLLYTLDDDVVLQGSNEIFESGGTTFTVDAASGFVQATIYFSGDSIGSIDLDAEPLITTQSDRYVLASENYNLELLYLPIGSDYGFVDADGDDEIDDFAGNFFSNEDGEIEQALYIDFITY